MARDFSGTSQYITAPTVALAGSCGFTFVINPDTMTPKGAATYSLIVGKLNGVTDLNGHIFAWYHYNPGLVFEARIKTSTAEYYAKGSAGFHTIGMTHRCAVIFDAGAAILHLYQYREDGATSFATVGTAGTFSDVGDSIYMGKFAAQADTEYDGRISEVATFSGTRTQEQIDAFGKGFSPLLSLAPLTRYWRLMGRVSPEPELMAASNGVLTGPPTVFVHPPQFDPKHPELLFGVPAPVVAGPGSFQVPLVRRLGWGLGPLSVAQAAAARAAYEALHVESA